MNDNKNIESNIIVSKVKRGNDWIDIAVIDLKKGDIFKTSYEGEPFTVYRAVSDGFMDKESIGGENITAEQICNLKEIGEIQMSLQWKDVDSSFVVRIAHHNDSLYVDLDHGSYVYNGVPVAIFERFLNSTSKGSFFNTKIKEVYTYTQLQ